MKHIVPLCGLVCCIILWHQFLVKISLSCKWYALTHLVQRLIRFPIHVEKPTDHIHTLKNAEHGKIINTVYKVEIP